MEIGRLKESNRVAFSSFIGIDMHYLLKANHLPQNGDESDIIVVSSRMVLPRIITCRNITCRKNTDHVTIIQNNKPCT